jgi:hypothetical protein
MNTIYTRTGTSHHASGGMRFPLTVIFVCPLIIRSILSFIPSHKRTPWDTKSGSQLFEARHDLAFLFRQCGYTFCKAKLPAVTTAGKAVMSNGVSDSTMTRLIDFRRQPNDSKARGFLFGQRNVQTAVKLPFSRDQSRKEGSVVFWMISTGSSPAKAGLTTILSRSKRDPARGAISTRLGAHHQKWVPLSLALRQAQSPELSRGTQGSRQNLLRGEMISSLS